MIRVQHNAELKSRRKYLVSPLFFLPSRAHLLLFSDSQTFCGAANGSVRHVFVRQAPAKMFASLKYPINEKRTLLSKLEAYPGAQDEIGCTQGVSRYSVRASAERFWPNKHLVGQEVSLFVFLSIPVEGQLNTVHQTCRFVGGRGPPTWISTLRPSWSAGELSTHFTACRMLLRSWTLAWQRQRKR